MMNFVITLSKFTAEPPARGSLLHSHFEDVMTQFIINKKTDAKKAVVNLIILSFFLIKDLYLDYCIYSEFHNQQDIIDFVVSQPMLFFSQ